MFPTTQHGITRLGNAREREVGGVLAQNTVKEFKTWPSTDSSAGAWHIGGLGTIPGQPTQIQGKMGEKRPEVDRAGSWRQVIWSCQSLAPPVA